MHAIAKLDSAAGRIPAEVKRIVYERDGGCCAFVGPDGRRCGRRWQLEFDHVEPVSQGGESTPDKLMLACRPHNFHHAEQTHGRSYMEKFRRQDGHASRTGESTAAGDSDYGCNAPDHGNGRANANRWREAPSDSARDAPMLPFGGG